jgi:hypothetical protein
MVTQVGYSVAERLKCREVLCAVYTVHVEMMSTGFLVEPENQGRRFVSGLASKPVVTVFSGLASKLVSQISQVGPKNRQLWFSDLSLKITAMISWFEPQN